MGNEMSDRKSKAKAEIPRNGPDGESKKTEEGDQTGEHYLTIYLRQLFALPSFKVNDENALVRFTSFRSELCGLEICLGCVIRVKSETCV